MTTRITGYNSGLDVDSLVKTSLTNYQSKIDTETQNKKILEYQQEQYKKIMTDSSEFYDKYFDVLKTGNLFSSSTYGTISFESGDDTKVTAKGFAGADVSDYSVKVTQLASKASHKITDTDLSSIELSKKGVISLEMGGKSVYVDVAFNDDDEIDMEQTVKDLNSALNEKGINVSAKYSEFSGGIILESGQMGEDISFQVGIEEGISEEGIADETESFDVLNYSTYNGTNAEGTITKGTETYPIDKASNIITVDNVQFTLKGVTTETSTSGKYINSSSITSLLGDDITTIEEVNKTEYTLTNGSKINIADDGTLTLTKADGTTPLADDETVSFTNASGDTITLKGDGTLTSSGFVGSKYITSSSISSLLGDDISKVAEQSSKIYTLTNESKITIADDGTTTITVADGTTITNADGTTTVAVGTTELGVDKTVSFTNADGETVTLNGNGRLIESTSGSVKLSGTTDVTALKDKIVKFFDDYNTLLSSINTKIYEERDKDYLPLTDEQKEAMTEDQIEKWETKSKTGLLRKDMDLERIANSMKSAMSIVISGSGLYLESIGISPVNDYAEKNGMYTVDEDKLTKALEENAGDIQDLFTRSEDEDTNDKGGIFTRLKSALYSEFKISTSSLSKKAGLDATSTQYNNTLTNTIYKKKLLIADLNDKYTDKETALYKKYSALETALQALTAQQSSLASMLGTS